VTTIRRIALLRFTISPQVAQEYIAARLSGVRFTTPAEISAGA
jgi:hypothetical protein